MPDAEDVGREARHVPRRVASITARQRRSRLLGDINQASRRPSRESRLLRPFTGAIRAPASSARIEAVCGRRIPPRRPPARSLLASVRSRARSGARSYRWTRHDPASPFRMRCEHAVTANERRARRRHQRCQSRQQLERRHHPMLCPTSTKLLDPIRDASARKHPESLERKRRPRSISAESLPTAIIVGVDSDARVEVEAFMLDRASLATWLIRVDAHGTRGKVA